LAQRANGPSTSRPRRCATESVCAHGRSIPKELFVTVNSCAILWRYSGHRPQSPQQGCLIWPATFCRIGLCRSGRDGSHAKGWNFFWSCWLMARAKMLPGRTDHATRAGPHALRLRDQPAPPGSFHTRPIRRRPLADKLRSPAMQRGYGIFGSGCQNGLQQQGHAPSHHQVVHILELSPHALYNVMDPCSLHIHDFALVVQVSMAYILRPIRNSCR